MSGHHWSTEYRNVYHVYGKITDNRLRNTNGTTISPSYSGVRIGHFNQDGYSSRPCIECTKDKFVIRNGDRIAQMVVNPVVQAVLEEVEDLSQTTRGADGFGSTGIK